MVRKIGFFVGLAFSGVLLISLYGTVSDYMSAPQVKTAEYVFHEEPKSLWLASDGPFGRFDRQQLQRGFQVYREVCAACHGLEQVAFRNLEELGYNEAEVEAIAAQWPIEVPTIDEETGEPATRPAIPPDRFPAPYANEVAARAANNNAYPTDLSLITKARAGGDDYIYSLLTGYRRQPAELLKKFPEAQTLEGLYYNPYFANLNIAMPPPLTSDGQVQYADGTRPTVAQMAKDVTAFLVWAAEPTLERRHSAGIAVIVFLLIATFLGYLAYRNIWATHKRKVRVTGPIDPKNKAKSRRASRKAGVGD
ncbi:MAG TPA: cytochrome c1 [Sphingomicrobium sp.]|nr:cytochrome c1 [Sphingomicrobium sp.]